MNKAAIIGIIIVIAIVIGVASSMSSMEKVGDDVLPTDEELILDEVLPTDKELILDEVLPTDEELILDEIVPEEDSAEEPETTGNSLTVELSESMKFKSP